MKIYNASKNLNQFLHHVASRKANFENLNYFHVNIGADVATNIQDIVTYISKEVEDENAALLVFKNAHEALVIVPSEYRKEIADFDRHIHNNALLKDAETKLGTLHECNHDDFKNIIDACIEPDDVINNVAMARALRMDNHIMVLDNDTEILQQVEQGLGNMGEVTALNSGAQFIERYTSIAPDILFLDIHLKDTTGPQLADKILGTIDPFAYIVIISSDTMKKTVMELRPMGIKGFVTKPFHRGHLFQHVRRAPTISTRSIKGI